MREIATITKVYDYNELCTEAQANVKQWLLADDGRDEIFSDTISEELKESFPHSELNVQYSLGSCQGDGLNIYGELNLLDVIGKFGDYSQKEQRALKFYFENVTHTYNFEVNRRYCYSCKFIDKKYIDEYIEDIIIDLACQEYANINKNLIKKFLYDMLDYFEQIDRKFENEGYDYLYNITDEEVEETCEANEYQFLEDGTFIAKIFQIKKFLK